MPSNRTLVVASLIVAAITIIMLPKDATAITKFECDSYKSRCLSTAPLIPSPLGGLVDPIMTMTCIAVHSQCLTLTPPGRPEDAGVAVRAAPARCPDGSWPSLSNGKCASSEVP
jgi:hypothetical protein